MNIIKGELNENEKFLSSKLPDFKPKFRQQFCVTGNKYEYSELSEVAVNKDKMTFIPKIFSNDPDAKIYNYIGLYSIGLLELLYLGFRASNDKSCQDSIAEFCNKFSTNLDEIIQDFEDIDHIYDIICSLAIDDGMYNDAFNIYFMMRTDYDKSGHETLLRYADWLMLIWMSDPKLYWELFFDIMEAAKLNMITVFKNYINPDIDFSVSQPWLDDNTDLRFNYIEYTIPDTDKVRKITDCRGLAIHMVLSLYYRLVYNYGYDCERTPVIKYNDERIIKYIDKTIKNCIGDDNQAKILKGNGINQKAEFNTLGMFKYNQPNNVLFTINSKKFSKHYYEELLLFMRRYNIDQIPFDKTINMHYSNIYNIFSTIGELLYMSSVQLEITHEHNLKSVIDELKLDVSKLTVEVDRQKKINQQTKEQYTDKVNDEIEQLKKQLAEAQSIIESKTAIIDKLTEQRDELNSQIANIYDDNTVDDTEDWSIDNSIDIDNIIKELNDFNIVLIGGRSELLSKVNKYGWVNVKQYDKNNISTGMDSIRYADFAIINTKFVSHTIVHKTESMIDSKYIMSYNGTNPEKLIQSTYDFIQKILME